MAETKLYRSFHGRVIGGVAGGLADFFGMDPTIVRLIFVLLAVFGGGGVLLYIILWIVLPEKNAFNSYNANSANNAPFNPTSTPGNSTSGVGEAFEGFGNTQQKSNPEPDMASKRKFEGSLIGGLVLILIGVFFLADKFIPNISFGDFWPLLLVVVGMVLIFNSLPGKNKNREEGGEV
ncbi:MAG: PspC domain-containing protein [Bacteroidales bacterium]|nr:PspC domain-containing protein [Bacteroidales bacterium]